MTPQALAGANLGVGVLSSAMTGFGQYEEGQQENKAYDYNADVQSEAIEQNFAGRVGKQASAYAASGVDIQSGSPLLVMIATAARGGQQAQQTSDALRYQGAMAAWAGTMGGIGTFLGGVSQSSMNYAKATGFGTSPAPTGGGS